MARNNSSTLDFDGKYSLQAKMDDNLNWIKNREKEIKESIEKENRIRTKEEEKFLANAEKFKKNLAIATQKEIHDKDLEHLKYMNELNKLAAEEAGNYIERAAIELEERVNKLKNSIKDGSLFSSISGTLVDTLNPIIDRFIASQTAISAHLSHSGSSLENIVDNLNRSLSASSIVKQEEVYNNLASLVKSGITYNVEQRAFLQTLSSDMDAVFNASNGTLTRLIRLQQQDSSANRLALEYNLQSFLNETYKNSEYIKKAFSDVSDALLEMRAMNSTTGQGVENTLQTWLGAMYSNGLSDSTAKSLASAFNALGSGDISNLGNGISNLVLMGVARAGLDYGDILNSGINANQTNQIMGGISTYLQEMGANSSHVVQSQLANLFGINVADIIAARNTGRVNTTINDNIGQLLGDYGGFVSLPTRMTNLLSNLTYSWGTNIASNPLALGTYTISNMLANNLPQIIRGTLGSTLGDLPANLVQALPLISLLPTGIETFGQALSSFNTLSGSSSQALGIFNALSDLRGNATTVKVSGGGVSGSAYIGNSNMSGALSEAKTSALDITDTLDIQGTKPEWEDNVSLITENTSLMLELMQDTMTSIRDDVNYVRNDFAYINATFQALAGNFSGAATTLGSTLL